MLAGKKGQQEDEQKQRTVESDLITVLCYSLFDLIRKFQNPNRSISLYSLSFCEIDRFTFRYSIFIILIDMTQIVSELCELILVNIPYRTTYPPRWTSTSSFKRIMKFSVLPNDVLWENVQSVHSFRRHSSLGSIWEKISLVRSKSIRKYFNCMIDESKVVFLFRPQAYEKSSRNHLTILIHFSTHLVFEQWVGRFLKTFHFFRVFGHIECK